MSSKAVSAHTENILRVDAERIDNLLNLVGELIIGKSMLQRTLNEFSRHHPKDSTRSRFADAMAFQSRVLNDLQRSVMKVRMVPVEQLFRRFPRMVRDVAKQCGKDVELRLSGQDTDLDKRLLDGIAEPLTHLVRNAVSHGIESAEERVRKGKPAQGIVHLHAYHHGNQVIVEISDDGRGIDVQKVKARARKQGLLSEQESGAFGESNALQLVFRPGFSTADEITEISGRGVGLDVVQSILQRLKGTVAGGDPSRPGHHLPPVTATHAGHYQSAVVPGGAAALCRSLERRGRNCARPGVRRAPGGQLRGLAIARPRAAGGPSGKPHPRSQNIPLPTAATERSSCWSPIWENASWG